MTNSMMNRSEKHKVPKTINQLIRRWILTTGICLAGFILVASFGFAQMEKSNVDPDKLYWVLYEPPGEHTEPITLSITREHNANNPVWFKMDYLISENGQIELSECLEVDTGYTSTSTWQVISKKNHPIFLAQGAASNEVKIRPRAWGPPGEYTGILESPNSNICIPVTIEIMPFANLMVTPEKISISADWGPRIYRANEMITVSVAANHPNWMVILSTTGLTYAGELKSGDSPTPPQITPELLDVIQVNHGGDVISQHKLSQPVIFRSNGNNAQTFMLWVDCTLGWQHIAGNYEGVIDIVLAQE